MFKSLSKCLIYDDLDVYEKKLLADLGRRILIVNSLFEFFRAFFAFLGLLADLSPKTTNERFMSQIEAVITISVSRMELA